MLSIDTFETLVNLYTHSLDLTERANNEALTADQALALGDDLKAEQHFRYSQSYREQAQQSLLKLRSLVDTQENAQKTLLLIKNEVDKRHPERSSAKDLAW